MRPRDEWGKLKADPRLIIVSLRGIAHKFDKDYRSGKRRRDGGPLGSRMKFAVQFHAHGDDVVDDHVSFQFLCSV